MNEGFRSHEPGGTCPLKWKLPEMQLGVPVLYLTGYSVHWGITCTPVFEAKIPILA